MEQRNVQDQYARGWSEVQDVSGIVSLRLLYSVEAVQLWDDSRSFAAVWTVYSDAELQAVKTCNFQVAAVKGQWAGSGRYLRLDPG